MSRFKLTTAAIERIKPPRIGQAEYFDEILPSFGMRVSYSGTKAWIVLARIRGKLVRLTLGRYPAMTLGQARDEARKAIDLIARGRDPRQVAADAKREQEEKAENTFERLAAEFLEKHARRNLRPSTAREYERILRGSDTAHWRKLPISEIRKRDVLQVLEAILERGKPGAARLALAYLRKFFNWCADREVIEQTPTDRINLEVRLSARVRTLSAAELITVWSALETEGFPFGPLFKLLLLTGQRRGEVAGMRWDELRDLEGANPLWEIPGSRTKNHQAHAVPLSPAARDLILSMPRSGLFVFSTTGRTSVSGFSRAKARIDQWIRERTEAGQLPPVADWTLHDLRRTMVTMMNEMGIAPHIVEAVVNHTSGAAKAGVAGVYNRALYLDDRRRALAAWSEFVDGKRQQHNDGKDFQSSTNAKETNQGDSSAFSAKDFRNSASVV